MWVITKPERGHSALRKGRFSAPSSDYFLTICTAGKKRRGLHLPVVRTAVYERWTAIESDGLWTVRTGVVMPDHIHVLARLGKIEDLSSVVRMFKGRMSPVLRNAGLRWEPSFFDHRMRADEDRLPVFTYIYLNPYRADLVNVDDRWSGYYCCEDDWKWFQPRTDDGCPYPEWLAG